METRGKDRRCAVGAATLLPVALSCGLIASEPQATPSSAMVDDKLVVLGCDDLGEVPGNPLPSQVGRCW